MKRITWIIVLLIFSLALAACGGDEPEAPAQEAPAQEAPAQEAPAAAEEPADAPAEEPAAEPTAVPPAAPTEAPEPTEAAPVETEIAIEDLQLSSLDELDSYRYDAVVTITGTNAEGAEVTQSMHMKLAVSADPPATSMIMTSEGTADAEEIGTMEFVIIGDTNYIVMEGMGCMALPATEDSGMPTADLTEEFSPEMITENLENVTFVGKETINGIDVLHYTYDETAMQIENDAGIISAEGHIYVAEDGGYMVRSIMDVTGNSAFMGNTEGEEFQTAATHIEMNLSDVGAAVEITPPAACEGQEAGGAADWPMLEDASTISSFAGIVSYTSELSVEEAIAFYDAEMMTIGYTQDTDASFVSGDTGFLTYVNEEGEEVSVTIAKDPASGLTSVTILSDSGY